MIFRCLAIPNEARAGFAHAYARAREVLSRLCGWRPERIEAAGGGYQALELGGGLDGGIVECGARRPLWLPYVEVPDIREATERARMLGAAVLLEPREGPAGWRSVVAIPAAGGTLWSDNMQVPVGSPRKSNAERLMDY